MAIFDAHARDRLQVFIDGQNLFGTLRALDKKLDYKSLMETMRNETRFIRAQYFTTIRPPQDNDKFHSVLSFLTFNGYSVMTKDVRDGMDNHGNVRTKGSMIGEMTAAMIDAADNGTDHIVLFSGDGELTAAVEACKRRDARVTVVSSERTHVVSEQLRRSCDRYIDLESFPDSVMLDLSDNFRSAAA